MTLTPTEIHDLLGTDPDANAPGDGEWATGIDGPEAAEVVRYHYPRYPGATDPMDMYLSRSGLGPYETDVDTIDAWLDAPRNIVGGVCLLSEPGTGKTMLAEAVATHREQRMTTVVCSPDDTKDSLFMRFVGEGNGAKVDGKRSPFALGPIPRAVKDGHLLYMDEVLLLNDGVKPAVLYPLADGRPFLPGGNVDGSDLPVHPDFRLIVSANPAVRGASLPEPLGSRFAGTTLTIETEANHLEALGIRPEVIAAWVTLGQAGLWRPQVRELRVASYWYDVDKAQAASAFLGEHCPESQRAAIRTSVISHLGHGAGLRKDDGRLIIE